MKLFSFTNVTGNLERYTLMTADSGYYAPMWINTDTPYYLGPSRNNGILYKLFDDINHNTIPSLSDYLK